MKTKIFFLINAIKDHVTAFLTLDNMILVVAITLIITLSIIIFFKRDKYTWRKSAPSLITTSGILCTFVGVSIGLARFNPDDSNSLKYLLDGLKLAFIPSAIAIFLAIVFKWISSKESSHNIGVQFINKMAENTAAVERLVTAVSAVDWQVKYKHSLEVNIDKNAKLLAVLESSLTELLEYARNKPQQLAGAINNLEESIKDISAILQRTNSTLSSEVNQISNQFKIELENQHNVAKTELQVLFEEISRLNQIIQQLGSDAAIIRDELGQVTHDISRNIEAGVSQKLNMRLDR